MACASLQHLHAMVAVVSHKDAPVAVDGDAALRIVELAVAAAVAADGAHVRSVAVIQHLHAMITMLNHNQMTRAVQRKTPRMAELAVVCALFDGPQVLTVA